jgi:hypothetical protein
MHRPPFKAYERTLRTSADIERGGGIDTVVPPAALPFDCRIHGTPDGDGGGSHILETIWRDLLNWRLMGVPFSTVHYFPLL